MNIGPLDEVLEKLNGGDPAAAEKVFRAYEPYLRMVVRQQMPGSLRAKFDSVDIVQSVWADVLQGFRKAGWRFTDSAHLRAFLIKVTRNRFLNRVRRHQYALEHERPLAGSALDELCQTHEPSPSEVAQAGELWKDLLTLCPPGHRAVLRLKRQGLPLAEIAARTGLHEGSVRRILYELARRLAAKQQRSAPSRGGES